MSYGQALTSTLPVVSSTVGPTYATLINEFLEELQSIVEAKVTPAGFLANADLSMADYRVTDLLATSYSNQSSPISAATYPRSLYFSGGDLYANNAAGQQIRITASGAVNVSTTAGITGSGYGSSGVEVNWDSSNVAYRMRSGSAADNFADVVCDDLIMNDGSGNYLSLRAPALASDYAITFPNAVPAANNTLMSFDTSGNASFTRAPTLASLTLDANGHVTISGTGIYKHGTRYTRIGPQVAQGQGTDSGWYYNTGSVDSSGAGTHTSAYWRPTGSGDTLHLPLTLHRDNRIVSWGVYCTNATGGELKARLFKMNTTGTSTPVGTVQTSVFNGDLTLEETGLTETVGSDVYYIQIESETFHASQRFWWGGVGYDQP